MYPTKILKGNSVVFSATLLALFLTGCAGLQSSTEPTDGTNKSTSVDRKPLPWPISSVPGFSDAVDKGTRTTTGQPGENYWQQEARYTLHAALHPENKRLDGRAKITYTNNSPDTLQTIHIDLLQNLHSEGVQRNIPQEITGGVTLESMTVEGDSVSRESATRPSYRVRGTRLIVAPQQPLVPGSTVSLTIEYSFEIPQRGAAGRMGYSRDNLFFIGYWYPQVAVYDDVLGWHTDQYLGLAEFYYDFADYEVFVTAPSDWLVLSTGTLQNRDEVLAPNVRDRLRRAETTDEIVTVIGPDETGASATAASSDGKLTWHFTAERVRDVAFSATKESVWKAARAPVDTTQQNPTDYTRVDAVYRTRAHRWTDAVKYVRHSITHLSRKLGLSYPYDHMTAVEGGGIIGGGMEYPMMTIIGDYNARSDTALYGVVAHELGHMWVPMIVNTNERRYSWMDEGMTTFNENRAKAEYYSDDSFMHAEFQSYLGLARRDREGPIIRRSDYHYTFHAFGVASYSKPASILAALKVVLGEDVFETAYRTFFDTWAYKHPYPSDFFNTFESVSGRDLDWFWRSWYFQTWTLDQAVGEVYQDGEKTQIVVEDRGNAPMPVLLTVTYQNGERSRERVPVDIWLEGRRQTTVSVPTRGGIAKIEIDAQRAFPDIDRTNNTWSAEE